MSHCGCDFGGQCALHAAEDDARQSANERRAQDGFRRDLQDRFARLEPYILHAVSCEANDLDPLDKTPCTCGLWAARKSVQQLIR